MSPRFPWRAYRDGTLLGPVRAANEREAIDRARLLYGPPDAIVVSEVAWSLLTTTERARYQSTAEIPPRAVGVPQIYELNGQRVADCLRCRLPVVQPARERRGGRPLQYHEECLSAIGRRSRRRNERLLARDDR